MSKSALKKSNIIRVLRTVWLNEGISRIEIANVLGLDKSTITIIVANLIERNILIELEEGAASPHGGRKPIKLKIRGDFCAVIGIEVQPEYCNISCVNLSGEILITKRFAADITAYSFTEVFRNILDDIETKLKDMNIPLVGIGLGLSGLVNPEKGIIYESIPLGVMEEYALVDELSKLTEVPVFIDNDGNCCCWGELIFNKLEDLQDFLFCLVEFREHHPEKASYGGLAIGMGIVIGGRVHYGKNYTAGEFRSIFAGKENPGQFAIESEAQFRVKDDKDLFGQFAVEYSRNVALMLNTFALSDCFIGGDLERYKDSFTGVLREELDKNWNYPGKSSCNIRYSSLGEHAVAFGAAAMIIDRIFTVSGHGYRDLSLLNLNY